MVDGKSFDCEFSSALERVFARAGVDADKIRGAMSEYRFRFGDWESILSLPHEALKELVGEKGALLTSLIISLAARRITDSFTFGKRHTLEEIKMLFAGKLIGEDTEVAYALYLDNDDRALGVEYVGEGTVNNFTVTPRRLIEKALKHNATRVIVAHNHPLGTAKVSEEDIGSTYKLDRLLCSAGINLVGHMVICGFDANIIRLDREGNGEAFIETV